MHRKLRLILGLLIGIGCLLYAAEAYAAPIAIESRAGDKFDDVVGMLNVGLGEDVESFQVILFFRVSDSKVGPLMRRLQILEIEQPERRLYKITCENDAGMKYSGTIDMRRVAQPKVELVSKTGAKLTTISEEGREFKRKYLPNVYLGIGTNMK